MGGERADDTTGRELVQRGGLRDYPSHFNRRERDRGGKEEKEKTLPRGNNLSGRQRECQHQRGCGKKNKSNPIGDEEGGGVGGGKEKEKKETQNLYYGADIGVGVPLWHILWG